MKPKIRPAVFRKAARLIAMDADEYRYSKEARICCAALFIAAASTAEKVFFEIILRQPKTFWWTRPDVNNPDTWCDQQARVLALLLAADVAEGGGL